MYRLNLPNDLKEAAALERKKQKHDPSKRLTIPKRSRSLGRRIRFDPAEISERSRYSDDNSAGASMSVPPNANVASSRHSFRRGSSATQKEGALSRCSDMSFDMFSSWYEPEGNRWIYESVPRNPWEVIVNIRSPESTSEPKQNLLLHKISGPDLGASMCLSHFGDRGLARNGSEKFEYRQQSPCDVLIKKLPVNTTKVIMADEEAGCSFCKMVRRAGRLQKRVSMDNIQRKSSASGNFTVLSGEDIPMRSIRFRFRGGSELWNDVASRPICADPPWEEVIPTRKLRARFARNVRSRSAKTISRQRTPPMIAEILLEMQRRGSLELTSSVDTSSPEQVGRIKPPQKPKKIKKQPRVENDTAHKKTDPVKKLRAAKIECPSIISTSYGKESQLQSSSEPTGQSSFVAENEMNKCVLTGAKALSCADALRPKVSEIPNVMGDSPVNGARRPNQLTGIHVISGGPDNVEKGEKIHLNLEDETETSTLVTVKPPNKSSRPTKGPAHEQGTTMTQVNRIPVTDEVYEGSSVSLIDTLNEWIHGPRPTQTMHQGEGAVTTGSKEVDSETQADELLEKRPLNQAQFTTFPESKNFEEPSGYAVGGPGDQSNKDPIAVNERESPKSRFGTLPSAANGHPSSSKVGEGFSINEVGNILGKMESDDSSRAEGSVQEKSTCLATCAAMVGTGTKSAESKNATPLPPTLAGTDRSNQVPSQDTGEVDEASQFAGGFQISEVGAILGKTESQTSSHADTLQQFMGPVHRIRFSAIPGGTVLETVVTSNRCCWSRNAASSVVTGELERNEPASRSERPTSSLENLNLTDGYSITEHSGLLGAIESYTSSHAEGEQQYVAVINRVHFTSIPGDQPVLCDSQRSLSDGLSELVEADVQDGITEKALQSAHRTTRTADGIRITEFGGLLGNIESRSSTRAEQSPSQPDETHRVYFSCIPTGETAAEEERFRESPDNIKSPQKLLLNTPDQLDGNLRSPLCFSIGEVTSILGQQESQVSSRASVVNDQPEVMDNKHGNIKQSFLEDRASTNLVYCKQGLPRNGGSTSPELYADMESRNLHMFDAAFSGSRITAPSNETHSIVFSQNDIAQDLGGIDEDMFDLNRAKNSHLGRTLVQSASYDSKFQTAVLYHSISPKLVVGGDSLQPELRRHGRGIESPVPFKAKQDVYKLFNFFSRRSDCRIPESLDTQMAECSTSDLSDQSECKVHHVTSESPNVLKIQQPDLDFSAREFVNNAGPENECFVPVQIFYTRLSNKERSDVESELSEPSCVNAISADQLPIECLAATSINQRSDSSLGVELISKRTRRRKKPLRSRSACKRPKSATRRAVERALSQQGLLLDLLDLGFFEEKATKTVHQFSSEIVPSTFAQTLAPEISTSQVNVSMEEIFPSFSQRKDSIAESLLSEKLLDERSISKAKRLVAYLPSATLLLASESLPEPMEEGSAPILVCATNREENSPNDDHIVSVRTNLRQRQEKSFEDGRKSLKANIYQEQTYPPALIVGAFLGSISECSAEIPSLSWATDTLSPPPEDTSRGRAPVIDLRENHSLGVQKLSEGLLIIQTEENVSEAEIPTLLYSAFPTTDKHFTIKVLVSSACGKHVVLATLRKNEMRSPVLSQRKLSPTNLMSATSELLSRTSTDLSERPKKEH
ncbi:unnamed protein product [Calicophoron daubneyi]|uniref:Uncharacterized protein n=1 Tax=Calicophoron daubneyi TaxID=300641 RepID=A0AAV2SZN6_CALDB